MSSFPEEDQAQDMVIDLMPDDQHDRVIVIFTDPSNEDQKMGFSVLWLIHHGHPYNAETETELKYHSTHLVH